MDGLGLLGFLIVGLVAGYIAEKATGSSHGLLTNLAVGIIGAFVGGFIANALGIQFFGFLGALVIATLGAIGFLYLLRLVRS